MKKTISNIFKLCLWLLIIASCYYSGFFHKISDKLNQITNHIENEQELGPTTAQFNEYIEFLIIQGQTTTDDGERYMALFYALGLTAYESVTKALIYCHYTDASEPPRSLVQQTERKVDRITDLMKQYYSDEFINEMWVSQLSMHWDDVIEMNFDRILGAGWTKWNIDLDNLWEIWLSKVHMVNGELDLKMPYS